METLSFYCKRSSWSY